jgi:hypothetical protein
LTKTIVTLAGEAGAEEGTGAGEQAGHREEVIQETLIQWTLIMHVSISQKKKWKLPKCTVKPYSDRLMYVLVSDINNI